MTARDQTPSKSRVDPVGLQQKNRDWGKNGTAKSSIADLKPRAGTGGVRHWKSQVPAMRDSETSTAKVESPLGAGARTEWAATNGKSTSAPTAAGNGGERKPHCPKKGGRKKEQTLARVSLNGPVGCSRGKAESMAVNAGSRPGG